MSTAVSREKDSLNFSKAPPPAHEWDVARMRARLLLLAVCAMGCAVRSEGKAHLLIQKAMLTNRPFAGKDLPIRYRIFNVGDAAAHDVTLEDEWSAEEFQPVSGLQSGTWSHIAP